MDNALTPSSAEPPFILDAHEQDPDAYDWVPMLKKRRADGWTPSKQRGFIEALEDALLCADILDGRLPHWREGAA